jgi:hypothetical protein
MIKNLLTRYNGFAIWARVVIGLAVALLAIGLLVRLSGAAHELIFGNTEAKREHGNVIVAQEQTKAEGAIAGKTIDTVHERDVYREHVTSVVHDGQEKVNNAWHGETVGVDVDAAGAAALCRVHDSLCRRAPAADVQPVCRPVPGRDGAC